jgi:hypothetical protein
MTQSPGARWRLCSALNNTCMAPNTVGWWRLVPHLTERDVVHDALVALDPLQLDGGDLAQDINTEIT